MYMYVMCVYIYIYTIYTYNSMHISKPIVDDISAKILHHLVNGPIPSCLH